MSIRVGLVTLNGNFNYGNRFQNYALQFFLENFGYQVETILYKSIPIGENDTAVTKLKKHLKSHDVSKIMLKKILDLTRYRYEHRKNNLLVLREESFKYFTSKYIKETEYVYNQSVLENDEQKKYLNLTYDNFFVGSDQVWNLDLNTYPDFFFLPFAAKKKRNSFAASFGVSEWM